MRVLLFVFILTGTVITDDPVASNVTAPSDDTPLIKPKIQTDIASEILNNTESSLAVDVTVPAIKPAIDLSGQKGAGREDNSANEQSDAAELGLEDTVVASEEDNEDGAGPSEEGSDSLDINKDTDMSKDDDVSSNQDADSKNQDEDLLNQDEESSNDDHLVALGKDDDSSNLNDQSDDDETIKPEIGGNYETSSNEVTTNLVTESDKEGEEADPNKGKTAKKKPDDMDDSPKVLDDDSLTIEKVSHFQSVKLLFYIIVPTSLLVLVYFVMKALKGRGRMLARYQILHSRATDNIELRPLGYDSDEEDIVFDSRNTT